MFHAKGGVLGGERAQVRRHEETLSTSCTALQVQRHCEEVAKIIQSFLPGCQDVQTILHARVPIIKYSHQVRLHKLQTLFNVLNALPALAPPPPVRGPGV